MVMIMIIMIRNGDNFIDYLESNNMEAISITITQLYGSLVVTMRAFIGNSKEPLPLYINWNKYRDLSVNVHSKSVLLAR